jgi:hypothetical protein
MKFIKSPYFFPIATAVLFVLAIAGGVISADNSEKWHLAFIAKLLLSFGYIVLGAWFLFAFTRADVENPNFGEEAEQRASMFRFAYFFSIFSFALLLLPFTAMVRTDDSPPDTGPIRLLRACVERAAIPAGTASAPSPIDLCPEPKGSPRTVAYPWLIAVGGVVARQCDLSDAFCFEATAKDRDVLTPKVDQLPAPSTPAGSASQAAARSLAPASSAAAAAVSGTDAPKPVNALPDNPKFDAGERKLPIMYRVAGGFVVPFYVVVFAFVGGIVNLTRRVPEYQKRSSSTFKGTATESYVSLLEAREFVVFQLMQLLSSPFVAMMAYYALEPKSVASAVGIAFFSGFATESVLLLLRGMFAGLRPEKDKTAADDASTSFPAQLLVTAVNATNQLLANATVELRSAPSPAPIIMSGQTGGNGELQFTSIPAGLLQVDANLIAGGITIKDSKSIQLNAGGMAKLQLTLV